MLAKERRDFCIGCRKEVEYYLKKKDIKKIIKGKEFSFTITTAICSECGEELSFPGLLDYNIREIDKQYREAEGLVSINDIQKLMSIYKIGKAPLSLALGFGEITITRYLEGQIPSKEYSDVIKTALTSPEYMKKCLFDNRDKISETAFRKAIGAVESTEKLFSISPKMIGVIAYIFNKLEEVTPLMLQKLLYYVQGIYSALYDTPIFEEDCRAWIHGPVYYEVFELFRDFKYNPIDDARFALFNGSKDNLSVEEKEVIDLVVDTFGMYGGKTLEKITHHETPWVNARRGYGDDVKSNEIISKKAIIEYFRYIGKQYDLKSEDGLKSYIHSILG